MKEVYYLQDPEKDPHLIESGTHVPLSESSEPLIIWTVHAGSDVLSTPEFTLLIQQFYFPN